VFWNRISGNAFYLKAQTGRNWQLLLFRPLEMIYQAQRLPFVQWSKFLRQSKFWACFQELWLEDSIL